MPGNEFAYVFTYLSAESTVRSHGEKTVQCVHTSGLTYTEVDHCCNGVSIRYHHSCMMVCCPSDTTILGVINQQFVTIASSHCSLPFTVNCKVIAKSKISRCNMPTRPSPDKSCSCLIGHIHYPGCGKATIAYTHNPPSLQRLH